ncbi:MAG: energy transducer TonB [Ignavibacteriales bacterium]|nr:energy transducer TonB [Ignavibacteriales bacterium]
MKNTFALSLVVALLLCSCASRKVETDNNNRGPIMISTVKAVYPKEAMDNGIEGDVWVKMWVDTLGKVTSALIEKTPDQVLCDAAMTAALKTKFKPAMLDGKPIRRQKEKGSRSGFKN